MAERAIPAIFSYAGRVGKPRVQPLPTRFGGFGGVRGLVSYLRDTEITHVVDATHPFAQTMSRHAVQACGEVGVPLATLTRPVWQPGPGDDWREVVDIDAAVAALDGPAKRVFLALGRMHLAAFAAQPRHHYLLRLVDQPQRRPLPRCQVVVARGPFDVPGDTALMQDHATEIVVCKNSGGSGARSKLVAARVLGLPVLMIARPVLPARLELFSPAQVLDWLDHGASDPGRTDLGV